MIDSITLYSAPSISSFSTSILVCPSSFMIVDSRLHCASM
ncbi:uncharacterized protein METZ01_LOCUS152563 [marine metagenome]|uniref:Uncharacterized protein n=1 Tax=marine metagenome TaxID=408172 RepID=A0A382AE80_9ZZZZ